MNRLEGDNLTVGDLISNGMVSGAYPPGTAAYENAELHSKFLNGFLKTVRCVMNAPLFVRMLPFVRF